jgi:predicted phage terminase large subunit-like protein
VNLSSLGQLHETAIRAELARRHLLDFTTFTFPGYKTNWHHRVMCDALDRLVFGDLKRLMIFTPPRHGKSELVSRRLPAYFLGNFPDGEVILSSYAADLANRMNTNVQQIMDSREYASVFPHIRLPGGVHDVSRKIPGMKRTRTNEYFEIVGHKGSLRSVGVGGGITGMGFNLGIIDDPVKDAEEAMSQVIRDKVWDWYTSTFWTRQTGFNAPGGGDAGARILLTMTRWHDDDLAGRLLALAADDPTADQWEVITLPGLSTEDNLFPYDLRTGPDQALWEDSPYGINFMHAARQNQPDYFFQAMYQQTPRRKGGGYFNRDWFGEFIIQGGTVFVPGRPPFHLSECFIWAGVDLASSEDTKADFTVVVVLAETPYGECLVLEILRERLPPNAIPGLLSRASHRWPVSFFAVEADGFQTAVVAVARRDYPGMPPIREVKHQGKGKLVRATKAIVRCENRQMYVPKEAVWKGKFFDELEVFTGDDDKHDDQVDALAYGVEQFGRKGMVESVEVQHGAVKIYQRDVGVRPSASTRRGLWGRR